MFDMLLRTQEALSQLNNSMLELQATKNFDKAKEIIDTAEQRYKSADLSLNVSIKDTQKYLDSLGALKVNIFNNQIKHLISVIKKTKQSSSKLDGFSESIVIENIENYEGFVFEDFKLERLLLSMKSLNITVANLVSFISGKNIPDFYVGQNNIPLCQFSSYVMSSAHSFQVIDMVKKSEEAITQANEYDAKICIEISKILNLKINLEAIQKTTSEMELIIKQVANKYDLIRVEDFTNLNKFQQMVALGKALKQILDIPIIKNGEVIKNVRSIASGYIKID